MAGLRVLLFAVFGVACALPVFGQSKTHLEIGEFLIVNEYLVAPDRMSYAVLQADGNLCVFRGERPPNKQAALWCSGSARSAGDYYAIFNPDADLCILRGKAPASNGGGSKGDSSIWCWGDKTHAGGRYVLRVEGSALCAYEFLAFPGSAAPRPSRLLWVSRKLNKLSGFAGR